MSVERVEAEVLDPPARRSPSDAWLSAVAGRVSEAVDKYKPYRVTNADEYRQAKRDRAALRREIAEIDESRKDMTRDVEATVRRFKANAKGVLAPLDELDGRFREEIGRFDDLMLSRRRSALESAYEEMAPYLAPLVPFATLSERWSREGKWYLHSTTEAAALEDMGRHVDEIAASERRLLSMPWESDEERDAARAHLFRCLDFGETVEWAQARRESARRVAELDARRAERPSVTSDEAPARPAPAPAGPEPGERTRAYLLELELTDAQWEELRRFLKGLGARVTRVRRSNGQ